MRIIVCGAVIVLIVICSALAAPAQQKRPIAGTRTVTGIVYRNTGGQGWRHVFIKTPRERVYFEFSKLSTRWVNLRDPKAWEMGAEWRVILKGNFAQSITFTGRVEEPIYRAQEIAWKYLRYIEDEKYAEAYDLLTVATKRKWEFRDFQGMYRPKKGDLRNASVCSHSADWVSLSLEFEGSRAFQHVEAVKIGERWYLHHLRSFSSGYSYHNYVCGRDETKDMFFFH